MRGPMRRCPRLRNIVGAPWPSGAMIPERSWIRLRTAARWSIESASKPTQSVRAPVRARAKNFRQLLARTLEPGTLPEILVDVGLRWRIGLLLCALARVPAYGAVSGPAQRIR